jgi:hypothetical protein
MRGKLWFALGAAAGFVLGARAGRDKYDEIVLNARKVWDHPTVQEAAGVVQAQANRLYHEGKDTMSDKLSHSKLGEKLGTGESASTGTGTGTGTSTTTGSTKSTKSTDSLTSSSSGGSTSSSSNTSGSTY